MKQLRLGILGYGTVGQGLIELLNKNKSLLSDRSGYEISVVAIAKRNWDGIEKPKGIECVTDASSIVCRDDIDTIVELIGGEDVAYNLIKTALNNDKHIITANKALIAHRGEELFALAKEKGKKISFEASVAGGIPILKSLKEGLVANEINLIAGIINGTSNYILSTMKNTGRAFLDVLDEAQKLGYAEADPSFDVDGVDAAHKLTILASIAFGIKLDYSKLVVEGIREITTNDVLYAQDLGYRIKHFGMAIRHKVKNSKDEIELRVHPVLVPKDALIANVEGVMNAVRVDGNSVGETLFYGAGAGSLPTASAVMADILELVRTISKQRISPVGYTSKNNSDNLVILPSSKHKTANYLRIIVDDEVGAMANITRILAQESISIEALIQKEAEASQVPIIILTQVVVEKDLQEAIKKIEELTAVSGTVKRIRVEHF